MNPYENLAEKHFWSTAVAKRNMFDIEGLWDPKFSITKDHKAVTFGSCFAQHIGRALAERKYMWWQTEPAPHGLGEESAKRFNYGVFSARTGNIYTVSLLEQWARWALDDAAVPEEVWEKDGRFYDPFRPNIEPNGFASKAEMRGSREIAIDAFRQALQEADIFVFTLGLTESWTNRDADYEYPMCPGTVAGEFDQNRHHFVNQDYPTIQRRLRRTIEYIRAHNPDIKVLLTVSPVPLTATMSDNHVLVATMESKSILRAVAGSMARQFDFVDYFPSYEIINSAPFRGTFFEANQRNVNHTGVAHVMSVFFKCLSTKFGLEAETQEAEETEPRKKRLHPRQGRRKGRKQNSDVCEEELLEAFAQ